MTQPIPQQEDGTNWKEQAQFWQLKYLELQQHTNQVITQLLKASVSDYIQSQLIAQLTQMGQAPTPQSPSTEVPSTYLANPENGAPGPN